MGDQLGVGVVQDEFEVLVGQGEPIDPVVDAGESTRCWNGAGVHEPGRVEDVPQLFGHPAGRVKVITNANELVNGTGDGVADSEC
ncbi:hypothetical protein ABDK96_10375 [Citricoccus nitrophenolicus]|uniref:Uncharacterized protein n=1 Tax=Citricoccus nitrophenolicus TaxID=863575 RepID=A0ABV0IIU6_9MICC